MSKAADSAGGRAQRIAGRIAAELGVDVAQVAATVALLAEGATVPFIARYRKEATGELDEVAVATIRDRLEQLAALDERKADLAILGTHGRSGFERLMIGSVASAVLRGASCNLLIVPPTPSERQDSATHREAGADWSYVSDEAHLAARQA